MRRESSISFDQMTTQDFLFLIKRYLSQTHRKVNITKTIPNFLPSTHTAGSPMKGWEEIRYQSPEEKRYTEEGEKVYKESIEAHKSPLEEKTSVKEFSPPMKDENIDIEKEIMMIDDNLRDMEKMFEEKKEKVERKKEKIEEEILEQQTGKDVVDPASGGQTLEQFKLEQSKYEKFPTKPADTRRYIWFIFYDLIITADTECLNIPWSPIPGESNSSPRRSGSGGKMDCR